MKKIHFGKILVIGLLTLFIGANFVTSLEPLTCDANGPYKGNIMEDIEFEGSATGGAPPYDFLWDYGDGNTSSGDPHPTHNYENAGNYTVTLTVIDSENNTANDTTWTYINAPPNTPIINGPTNGKVGEEYCWKISSVDPDGDDLMYIVEWGDGDTTETECYPSGMEVEVCHTYTDHGTFIIKIKAKDCPYGSESDWMELTVTMPRTKPINTPFQWLQNFLQSHPNMFPIIRQLLGL